MVEILFVSHHSLERRGDARRLATLNLIFVRIWKPPFPIITGFGGGGEKKNAANENAQCCPVKKKKTWFPWCLPRKNPTQICGKKSISQAHAPDTPASTDAEPIASSRGEKALGRPAQVVHLVVTLPAAGRALGVAFSARGRRVSLLSCLRAVGIRYRTPHDVGGLA